MKPEEIDAKLKEFQATIEAQKKAQEAQMDAVRKDFELKMESAQREAESWKTAAQEREKTLAQFKEQTEAAKKQAEEALKKVREQDVKAFVEELKKSGKITPAIEDKVISLMGSMTSETEIAKFKEADGSVKSHTQLSLLKAVLTGLPRKVVYGENTYGAHSVTPETPEGNQEEEQYMEVITKAGGRHKLPVQGTEIAEAAEKYLEEQRAKGKVVSYADALIAVTPRNKVKA